MMTEEEREAWKLANEQKLQLRKEAKEKDFEHYIYDFKIWEKCKKVIVVYDDPDIEEEDSEDDHEFWTFMWFHETLFEKYYDKPNKYTSRLECLVMNLKKVKHEILEDDFSCIGYDINKYDNLKNVIREWITHTGIATKQMLIEQLPLCDDVHKLILELKIF